ncbi:MAG TPA: type IV pilus secretin PilQ [Candidatus Saccharimonadales bacterium]|nr:type IV pilus secretin PilQ [Candidatus Saccharimonadales bacterium]
MKCKRLLTVLLMALFCAGTAMAASQLNSLQVTPKENTAVVNLRTTGSFAHKEYRPSEHTVLVDLTGVNADAAIERVATVSSAVLKSYKLSDYTSASGSHVTRIELALGDGVGVEVVDRSDGLQILLSGNASTAPVSRGEVSSVASSFPVATATVAAPKPAAPASVIEQPVQRAGDHSAAPAVAGALAPTTTIRNISVQRGNGTLDVIIEGPTAASPFVLENPDRLVVDFSNAVVKASVKNVLVRSKDVRQVRVGRYQGEPPVTRIVIDLSGPRTFEVVPSATQVIVRVKSDQSANMAAPVKAAPLPALASAEAPVVAGGTGISNSSLRNRSGAHSALASASRKAKGDDVALPPASPLIAVAPVLNNAPATVAPQARDTQVRESQLRDPKLRAGAAADTLAATPQRDETPQEIAKSSTTAVEQLAKNSRTSSSASKYTGEPISVNLKDVDLKDFFRLIHEISGLNIVLDPNVKGSVTLVLDDVPWDQALDIVLKNNSLDRELQGNVLRIAGTDTLRREAVDRRAQSEAVALAVDRQTISRFLSYAKAKDVVPTIKKFLTPRGDVISDERTNALIISDIPSVLPNLDRLISQLDKKSQEVEIEVRVVSATRSFSRDLGVQLGFNWGNGVSAIGGANPNGTTSTTVTNPTTGSTTTTTTAPSNSVPLFTNFPVAGATTGLSLSNVTKTYGIDAILTAAESHNLAKILSRPRVVTQSNVKAEVKQGVKIPVYTASTANSNPSVTYIDSVLRLSVVPQITSDNTIFLTVDVENTQPGNLINGNYVLTTQQATTQVLVTDGGTIVIGGVIQTTNTVSTSQTPLLGDIPWLGNLFKQRSVKTETDELIFFITPKIIQT